MAMFKNNGIPTIMIVFLK